MIPRLRIRHLRLSVQVLVGFFFLNLTVYGSYVIAPLLPVIRLDYPGIPNTVDGGQRVCDAGILYRGLSSFWPMAFLVISIGLLLVIGAIFGRALCGWLCPIGMFQDLVTKIRTALGLKPKEFRQATHVRMTGVKYAILILAILLAAATGLSLLTNYTAGEAYKGMYPEGTSQVAPFCAVCPAPSIYYVGSVLDTGDFQFNDPTRFLALAVLGSVFIGGFVQPRFWCRYLCPVGATTSLFNKVSLLSIRKNQAKCTNCNYCYTSCPMRIEEMRDEDKNERVMDMNCTFCLECIENCPEKALKLSMANKSIYHGGRDWWKRRGTKPQIEEFEGSVPEDDIGK